jgi:hypothetical protein
MDALNFSPKKFGLTNNQLKIIAMISMLIDHIGVQIFPNVLILRIIGRLAFPIFAYMIAEGCLHTKNKARYLLIIFGLGFICQLVFYFFMGSLYQGILMTFSLSIICIYAIDYYLKNKNWKSLSLMLFTVIGISFISVILPIILKKTDFEFDYTALGILLPVAIYFSKYKLLKLTFIAIISILLSSIYTSYQLYSLLALPLLLLYNGERGKYKLKYMFYIFYPAHLVIVYFLSFFLR